MRVLLLLIASVAALWVPATLCGRAQDVGSRVGAITGRVTAPDGTPVAGATVALYPRERAFESVEVITDREGRYRLPLERAPGDAVACATPSFDVQVDAADHALARRVWTLAAGSVPQVDFQLRPGLTVRGTIQNTGERAIAGVRVHAVALLSSAVAPLTRRQAHSDEDGHFRLAPLPRAPLLLGVHGGGLAPAVHRVAALPDTPTVTLPLVCEPAQFVKVLVSRNDGGLRWAPSEVALVQHGREILRLPCDRFGRVRLDGLARGSYDLRVMRGGITLDRRPLTLPRKVSNPVFLAVPGGATVYGAVRRGDARRRCLVRVYRRHDGTTGSDAVRRVTALDGTFDINDLPPGDYELLATPVPDGEELTLGLFRQFHVGAAPVAPFDLDLATAKVARFGCALVDESGRAVSGARVELYRWSHDILRAQRTSDASGVARLTTEPGLHAVRVFAPGFKPYERTDVKLAATPKGSKPHMLAIRLHADQPDGRLRRFLRASLPTDATVVLYDSVTPRHLLELLGLAYPEVIKLQKGTLPETLCDAPRYQVLPVPDLLADVLGQESVAWRLEGQVLWIGEQKKGQDSHGR